MLKVGLTGGYATGKSFVAGELARLGCHLIYADKLGHEVLLRGNEAYGPTVELFGAEILGPDGEIDRRKLGAIVFASPGLLARLTAIVHPAVFRLEEQMLRDIDGQDPTGIAVIEAAILIESGRANIFDRLLLTTCDEEIQIARGIKRDGVTREEALARIARQMPFEDKKQFAHYVIDTSSSKEETLRRIQGIFAELKALP